MRTWRSREYGSYSSLARTTACQTVSSFGDANSTSESKPARTFRQGLPFALCLAQDRAGARIGKYLDISRRVAVKSPPLFPREDESRSQPFNRKV
jgi:hypothetical protein